MEITGKIIAVLPERQGQGRNGMWVTGQYVIETVDQYPKKCVFDVFGRENIDKWMLKVGDYKTVHCDVDAREYQGRWYNSIKCWKVTEPAQPMPAMQPQTAEQAMNEALPVHVQHAMSPSYNPMPNGQPAQPVYNQQPSQQTMQYAQQLCGGEQGKLPF